MKLRLSVAVKLSIAVAIAIVAILGQALLAQRWIESLVEREDHEVRTIDATLRATARWVALTETNLARVQATVIATDSAVDAAFKGVIASGMVEIQQAQRMVEAMEMTADDRKALDAVLALNKTASESLQKLREHRAAFRLDEARAESEKVYLPSVRDYLLQLRNFAGSLEARAGAAREAASAERGRANRVVLAALAAILAGLAIGAALLIRSVRRPLLEAVAGAEHIAQGDLQWRLDAARGDEFGDLMRAMQRTVVELNRMVGGIKATSDAVGTAAGEIAEGHADLSARTEEQASSLEQTAASMEQMAATVAQNAENARKASKRAAEASAVAERGGEAVATVVSTMEGISKSSRKIADITGVIDGIAFQTNILALNAAVEAARAGEQGRGFAVVAAEVRSLAQRSAAAAKEIRQLIADSVGRVDAGSKQVAQAGETMAEIVATIRRVSKRVAEISAASQEQSQSLTQVSDTVAQLEKVTQQNAAMVEQASAASDSLKEQAATLAHAVGGFKLATADRHGMRPAATAATAAPARPQAPAATALPKGETRPAVAELPRKAAEGKAKARKAGNEDWEEF